MCRILSRRLWTLASRLMVYDEDDDDSHRDILMGRSMGGAEYGARLLLVFPPSVLLDFLLVLDVRLLSSFTSLFVFDAALAIATRGRSLIVSSIGVSFRAG